MRRALLLSLPLVVACVGVVVLFRSCEDDRKTFAGLDDCRAWAASHGYRVSPKEGSPLYYSLLITDRDDVDLNSVSALRIPARVAYLRLDVAEVASQIPGEPVRWGRVFVWGDADFIAELEAR